MTRPSKIRKRTAEVALGKVESRNCYIKRERATPERKIKVHEQPAVKRTDYHNNTNNGAMINIIVANINIASSSRNTTQNALNMGQIV